MKRKTLIISLFVLVALVQIYVPASMVYNSEMVLYEGKPYKFKTAPVDPADPFRGRYVTLQYDIRECEVGSDTDWTAGEAIYVLLTTDADGYAAIREVSRERPDAAVDYVPATVDYVRTYHDPPLLMINYPFNRFYMEESKAGDAEDVYRESQRDTSHTTHALVYVKNGSPVIGDVFIDEVPIGEAARKRGATEGK